jgi:hypothetical protein
MLTTSASRTVHIRIVAVAPRPFPRTPRPPVKLEASVLKRIDEALG